MKIINFLMALITMLISNFVFAQWGVDVRLTNDPGSSYTSINNAWCTAASGNIVHSAWYDNRDGNSEIYYKRSTDGGVNWGSDIRFTNNSADSYYPCIAVTGINVHVVWYDDRDGNEEIYYKRSTNGGITWGTDTRLTNNSASANNPSIAVTGTNVHTVWYDNRDGNYEIYFKRSTDGGVTWGADTRLTNNSSNSYTASIAVTGSHVHVVWEDNRDGNYEIYYKRSTDGGVTWGSDTRLMNNSADSDVPSIAVAGSFVHVVWYDDRDGNDEIYYKRSTNEGTTWGADTRLTNNFEESIRPSITVSGSGVHIVWRDSRDNNEEIYCKSSANDGTAWGADIRLTNNSGSSHGPSISSSGSFLHVLWQDIRDGNWEIYCKRYTFIPLAPVLISPANGSGSNLPNVLLDWTAVQYASDYRIQIASDSLFGNIVFDTNSVTRDSLRMRFGVLTLNTRYYWRVNASNVSGTGPWSPVWNFLVSITAISQIGSEIPSYYSLKQNYPNPFNPVTNIEFSISGAGLTKLVIYDALGREIETLANSELTPGTYSAAWDASKLNSGVYFYRLTAGRYSETKKMLMVK